MRLPVFRLMWVSMMMLQDRTGACSFLFWPIKKRFFRSPVMKSGTKPVKVDISLKGVKQLWLMVEDGGDGINYDHADWADAYILYKGG